MEFWIHDALFQDDGIKKNPFHIWKNFYRNFFRDTIEYRLIGTSNNIFM